MHQCYKGMCHLNLSSALKMEASVSSKMLPSRLHCVNLQQTMIWIFTNVRTQISFRNNLRFTFTDMVEILCWLLVALFQEVYQLLATLWHQHKHHLHLAGCEGWTQCGSHVLPALTCNMLTDSCQTLLVSRVWGSQITSQVKFDSAVSKLIIN